MGINRAAVIICCGLAAAMPAALQAGSTSYICEITGFLNQPADDSNPEAVAKLVMETPLAIDRLTGRAVHPFIGNTWMPDVEVIDPGSDQWSFKAIGRSADDGNGHVHVVYYEVNEFAAGMQKPFLAIGEGFAYSGLCQ